MNERIELPSFELEVPATPDLLVVQHDDYRRLRDGLHVIELRGEPTKQASDATVAAKEAIAYTTLALYAQSGTLDDFVADFKDTMDGSKGAQEDALRIGIDDPVLAAHIYPLSLLNDRSVSPTEAVLTTARNLAVARQFSDSAQATADGVLLSGSTAWGSFYAVRGGVPAELREIGVPQIEYSSMSDIDIVVTAKDDEALGATVEQMVEEGLLEPRELERFDAYLGLRREGGADLFSVRSHFGGVEESVHFIPSETMRIILTRQPYRRTPVAAGHAINTLKDFRPNVPGSLTKEGGYTLGDLRELVSLRQVAEISPVGKEGRILGYVSRTPVGAPITVEGQPTFAMGIMTFLTNVYPIMLFDRDGGFRRQIEASQHDIAGALGGHPATNVMRRNRMPRRVLRSVLDSLS